jgi:hypothetical protein
MSAAAKNVDSPAYGIAPFKRLQDARRKTNLHALAGQPADG